MKKRIPQFSFSLVGPGRLGKTLARHLQLIGGECKYIISTNETKLDIEGISMKSTKSIDKLDGIESLGHYCFICVPDDHISLAAVALLENLKDLSGTDFIHTSGTKSSSVLLNLKSSKNRICAFHPMQTFTADDTHEIFKSILISIEGDPDLSNELFDIAEQLGSKPLIVSEVDKKVLHIAGVILANFISALVIEASNVISFIDDSPEEFIRETYGPLMMKTLDNILHVGLVKGLTGPAARGDLETISEHKLFLQNNGYSTEVYDLLTKVISDYVRNNLKD